MKVDWRRTRVGAIGLVVLASCFRGPVHPTATLSPRAPDAAPARAQGPFAVVYAAPKGLILDREEPGVTVMFSRAVRAVDTADDERLPAITITTKSGAPVAGSFRWTGTRGLLFTPDGELPGGSDFVVTVPADVTALDGSVLGAPYTLELATPGPSVTSIKPLGPPGVTEKALPGDVAFRVELDQSVEPEALAKASTLRVFKADGDRGEDVGLVASREPGAGPTTPSAARQGKVVPSSYVVVLRPSRPLPLDHQVQLTISNALRGTGGPRPMRTPVTRLMRTHGPLRVADVYCPRIEPKGRCRAGGDVKLVFSTPVSPDEVKRHVRASLPARPSRPGEQRRLDPSTEHWLGVAPKLGEQYRVTALAGLRDVYGQTLGRDTSFDVVIEAPLTMSRAPNAPAAEAVPRVPLSAYDDSRPRRERLPYQLDLGLSGTVLEAHGGHRVPVGAINVPTYATVAAPLTDAQAVSWTLARGTTADFVTRNGLASTWTTTRADVNQRAVEFIDLDATLASRKGRGPALVVLAPSGSWNDTVGKTESLVTVTDLGVSAKMSPFGSLVWVTQLSTGKPVGGATVALHTTKAGEVFKATTDADGLVIVPPDRFDPLAKNHHGNVFDDERVRDDAAILVRWGDDFTISKVARSRVEGRLTSGIQKLSGDGEWAGMLFADRGVFRPGETAKVSGIVRVAEGAGLRSVAGRELQIALANVNGDKIFDGRATCDDFGTFSLDLPIPKTASLGTATITAVATPGGASKTSEAGVFRHDIRILAFKPNEFKVTAEADQPYYVRGDTATFSLRGDYLYGAPMQGASVTTFLSRQEVPFTPPGTGEFTTSDDVFTDDYADATRGAEHIDSGEGELDEGGRFERRVDLSFDDQRRPERVVFEGDVHDLSRSSVAGRAAVLVHPAEFYVGVRTPKDRFAAAGTQLETEIAAFEPSGARRAGVKVKVELVERTWNSVTGEQPDGRPLRSSTARDAVLASCDATTSLRASGCALRVPRAGYFVLRATARDRRNNVVRASTSIYGTEEGSGAQAAWAADDRRRITLDTNKSVYDVGETAKVALRSPFNDGQALVTVERNGVLYRKVVPIKGALPVVDIPVRPEFYPNAFVSVVAIRGRVAPPPASGTDLGAPDFRLGFAELTVNQEARRLNVAITDPKREYQPGQTVDAEVTVKDQSGAPVESALTFYVVDEGVLALTSYTTPDPLPAFVTRRKTSVFSLDNREALARILPMRAGERVSPLGYEYSLAYNPGDAYDKGDYGGDGGQTRADFRTTAFFEAGKKTDESGKARFSFKLPDNLTTFRIMAVAAAADDRFGSGESSITTSRRLMARPALPRLVRVGDSLEASVVVSSKPEEREGAMKVDVRIDAKGLALTGPSAKSITMPRGGQMEVRFPVKATDPGEATIAFEVRSGSDVDRVEVKRKVELPVSLESVVAYGETTDKAAVGLGDLSAMRRDYGGLEVRVAPTALVGLGTSVDWLSDYPYGCTEQITSKMLPLVAMLDLAKETNARLPRDVNGTVEAGLDTLIKRQNGDGGFGFWDETPSEQWLSAYTMLVLATAADQKRFVPKDVLERGRDYLTSSLAAVTRRLSRGEDGGAYEYGMGRDDEDAEPSADRAEREALARAADFVNAALIADTLATLGSPNPGANNILYDARAGQRLFGQAALLHAMAKSNMKGGHVKALTREIEQRLRVGPRGIDVDEADSYVYGSLLESRARTLAMILRALLATDAKHPLAPRIARRLLDLRQENGAWRTTQENGWALLALADYRRAQESGQGEIQARALLGGSELLAHTFPRKSLREVKVFAPADALVGKSPSLSFEVRGAGTLFYSANLKYAATTLPTRARDEGLFVTKYVRGVPSTSVADALATIPKRTSDAVNAGDMVIVDLIFESAEPRDRVLIDDPLPAGLEALDYDLDTTSMVGRDVRAEVEREPTFLGTTFRRADPRREVHDDRVINYFDRIEPGMYRVRYLARATSIGSFVVPPTRIEAMYEPEIYGQTAASALTVRPKP